MRFSSKFCTVASCAVLLSALSACSTVSDVKSNGSLASDSTKALALQKRESALEARERLLVQREAKIQTIPASAPASHTAGLTPPNAKPGQCFTKIFTPAKYRTVTERKLIEEAGQRIEVVPASYKSGSKRVLVTEASEKLQVIPATYKTVTERVLVKPASKKLVQVPATYANETTRVLQTPARQEWKKGTGPIQRIDHDTGDIMCLVDVPATYKNITKRVLKTPATTRTVEIPAEYKTVKVRKQVSAASESRTPIPAEYGTVERQVIDQKAGFVWHIVSNTDHPTTTRTGNQICLAESKDKFKTVKRTVVKTPAQTEEIIIPAKFKDVEVTKLVSPATEDVTVIPAVYRDVERRELVKDGYMAWRSILCETNMTRSRIGDIQRALQAAGHDIGSGGVDGVIGADTIKAVNAFQRANDLPVDRYINIATLKKLGVSAR